jgi:Fe-S cluster biogenesis protein NfuA
VNYVLRRQGRTILNNITWLKRNPRPVLSTRRLQFSHDCIIWVGKTDKYHFNYEELYAAACEGDTIKKGSSLLRVGKTVPFLRADSGDCELVGIDDDLVRVKMTGACIGCQFASATISGVQERLIAALGTPLRVISVPHVR